MCKPNVTAYHASVTNPRITAENGSVSVDNNVISDIVITDASGNDVTDRYYEITTENGTLTVQQRNVTVIAGSKVKEYNGLPLTYNYYELEGDSFLEGHTLKVEISGSITEIGWIHNKVSSYVVLDEQGTDVTKYYNVETVDGVLEVVEEMIYFKLVLNSGKGKGTTDTVYLKMESLGNYDPLTNSWGTAPRYNKLIYDSESAYYLPAYGMEDSGITTYNLTINPVGGLFALPYYTFYDDTGSQQQSDTYLSGDAYYTYTVTYFKYGDNYFSNIELPEGELTQYEKDYREFVYKNYLDVDGETEAYLLEIIAAKGFNKNKASIINDVAKYIKSVARYKLDYDQSIDTAKNPVIEFFEKKEGVCRHYATAATLLFRTLGIPARYTTGFMGTATEGVETNVTTSMAHAWVEVYVDGKGWTRVEVTGTADGGVTFPVKMTVTPTATYAVYDGTVHNPTQSISGFNLGEYGYTYQVVVEGSSANLGYTTTRITNLIIHNSFGELVYDKEAGIGLDKFIITYKTGTLQNYISALSFRSDGFTKTYDGIEYVLTEEECHLISGTLAEGYTYVITPTTVMTDVGQDQNVFEVNIYKDGVLCNDHYRISRSYGTLKITNRSITIKAKDASKYYDGSALTCHEIEYLESELAEGDYIAAYEVSGSQTGIGKSVNQIVRIVIKNKNGKDVTSNYSLNTKTGILEVRIK